MKRCSQCRRDYYDDTLSFCLEDGAELVHGVPDGEPATAILSELEGSYKNSQLMWLNVEPLYDPLRNEPRFRELVKKVGFPN